jgi:hypothetical protein
MAFDEMIFDEVIFDKVIFDKVIFDEVINARSTNCVCVVAYQCDTDYSQTQTFKTLLS